MILVLYLQINGKYVVKSGTDFRNFALVTLRFTPASLQRDEHGQPAHTGAEGQRETGATASGVVAGVGRKWSATVDVNIEERLVTSDIVEDERIKKIVDEYTGLSVFVVVFLIEEKRQHQSYMKTQLLDQLVLRRSASVTAEQLLEEFLQHFQNGHCSLRLCGRWTVTIGRFIKHAISQKQEDGLQPNLNG